MSLYRVLKNFLVCPDVQYMKKKNYLFYESLKWEMKEFINSLAGIFSSRDIPVGSFKREFLLSTFFYSSCNSQQNYFLCLHFLMLSTILFSSSSFFWWINSSRNFFNVFHLPPAFRRVSTTYIWRALCNNRYCNKKWNFMTYLIFF